MLFKSRSRNNFCQFTPSPLNHFKFNSIGIWYNYWFGLIIPKPLPVGDWLICKYGIIFSILYLSDSECLIKITGNRLSDQFQRKLVKTKSSIFLCTIHSILSHFWTKIWIIIFSNVRPCNFSWRSWKHCSSIFRAPETVVNKNLNNNFVICDEFNSWSVKCIPCTTHLQKEWTAFK